MDAGDCPRRIPTASPSLAFVRLVFSIGDGELRSELLSGGGGGIFDFRVVISSLIVATEDDEEDVDDESDVDPDGE